MVWAFHHAHHSSVQVRSPMAMPSPVRTIADARPCNYLGRSARWIPYLRPSSTTCMHRSLTTTVQTSESLLACRRPPAALHTDGSHGSIDWFRRYTRASVQLRLTGPSPALLLFAHLHALPLFSALEGTDAQVMVPESCVQHPSACTESSPLPSAAYKHASKARPCACRSSLSPLRGVRNGAGAPAARSVFSRKTLTRGNALSGLKNTK